MTGPPIIHVSGIRKTYGRTVAVDEVSFDAPNLTDKSITIDAPYVRRMLADIVKNEELSRYIL